MITLGSVSFKYFLLSNRKPNLNFLNKKSYLLISVFEKFRVNMSFRWGLIKDWLFLCLPYSASCVCARTHAHIYMRYTCQNDENNCRCHVYAIFSEKKKRMCCCIILSKECYWTGYMSMSK